MAEPKHNCTPCGQSFDSEEEYNDHECPVSGYAPTEPENLGEDFKAISEAALKRGADRVEEDEHPAMAAAKPARKKAKKGKK